LSIKPISEKGKIIWQLYRTAKEGQSTTIRSGYGIYGIYPYDKSEPFDFTRSESDAEHVFGTLILLSHIGEFYRDLVPSCYTLSLYMQTLLFHELGENESGDIPDDGQRDDAKKDKQEYQYISDYLEAWPTKRADLIKAKVREMQNKSSVAGKLIYCVDKTEAILQNFIYEAQGRSGDAATKEKMFETFSERDQSELIATNSTKPADMWAYGFYDRYRKYPMFDIFFDIIRAAALDVRGEDFTWLPENS